MATAETVDLGPAHPPKADAIDVFTEILPDLKRQLVHLRHKYNKHETEYFAATANLSDAQLVDFDVHHVESVRVAKSAYGVHLFAKLLIPELASQAAGDDSAPAYVHFRVFTAGAGADGGGSPPSLHSVHTEEKKGPDGDTKYRAIFTKDDELVWFDA